LEYISQFVVFGNYAHWYHPNLVRSVLCLPSNAQVKDDIPSYLRNHSVESATCVDHVPNGWHYAWTSHKYNNVQSQLKNRKSLDDMHYRGKDLGEFTGIYSKKFGIKTLRGVESVMLHGMCLQHALQVSASNSDTYVGHDGWDNKLLDTLCDRSMSESIHEELSIYGYDYMPNMTVVRRRFSPDRVSDSCPKPTHT
jgi:hypothetical protein